MIDSCQGTSLLSRLDEWSESELSTSKIDTLLQLSDTSLLSEFQLTISINVIDMFNIHTGMVLCQASIWSNIGREEMNYGLRKSILWHPEGDAKVE